MPTTTSYRLAGKSAMTSLGKYISSIQDQIEGHLLTLIGRRAQGSLINPSCPLDGTSSMMNEDEYALCNKAGPWSVNIGLTRLGSCSGRLSSHNASLRACLNDVEKANEALLGQALRLYCLPYLRSFRPVVEDVYCGKHETGRGLVVSSTEGFRESMRIDWPKIAFSPNWD